MYLNTIYTVRAWVSWLYMGSELVEITSQYHSSVDREDYPFLELEYYWSKFCSLIFFKIDAKLFSYINTSFQRFGTVFNDNTHAFHFVFCSARFVFSSEWIYKLHKWWNLRFWLEREVYWFYTNCIISY